MKENNYHGKWWRELYYTFKTKSCAPNMNHFEYFCWRIVRQRKLNK